MTAFALTKDLEYKARALSLAGDPTRIRILKLLARGKKLRVSRIAKELAMSIACVSHHLQLLKDNGLVFAQRSGNSIYYSLKETNTFIKNLITLIK